MALSFASSSTFLSNAPNLPNIAIAASGGRYHAMVHGAALLNEFLTRTTLARWHKGVILQLATYITGLSGSSWCVGSLAVNDFPTIFKLRDVWSLKENIVRILHIASEQLLH